MPAWMAQLVLRVRNMQAGPLPIEAIAMGNVSPPDLLLAAASVRPTT